MTIGDLIARSLQSLGLVAPGDAVPAEMSTLGLERVNEWIDGLANDNLTVQAITRTTWAITGATSYTIGTGGAVNVARPVSPQAIENIGILDSSGSETIFGAPLSDDGYEGLTTKGQTGPLVLAWYYRPTAPLGTLIPWPLGQSGTSGVIYTQAAVTGFAALTDALQLAQGYQRFFRTHLAMELADAFDAEIPATLARSAQDSKALLMRANMRFPEARAELSALMYPAGPSNIYTGT